MSAEHRQLAIDANVARELDGALVRDDFEPVEINAGLDFDAAGRDHEIDDDGGAELERGFDLVHAARRHADGEEAAAAEQRNGDAERMLARSRS